MPDLTTRPLPFGVQGGSKLQSKPINHSSLDSWTSRNQVNSQGQVVSPQIDQARARVQNEAAATDPQKILSGGVNNPDGTTTYRPQGGGSVVMGRPSTINSEQSLLSKEGNIYSNTNQQRQDMNTKTQATSADFLRAYLVAPFAKQSSFILAYVNGLTKKANRASEFSEVGSEAGRIADLAAGDMGEGAVNAYNSVKNLPGQIRNEISAVNSGTTGGQLTPLQRAYQQNVNDIQTANSALSGTKSEISTGLSDAKHIWNTIKAPWVGGSYQDMGSEGGRAIGGAMDLGQGALSYPKDLTKSLWHRTPLGQVLTTRSHLLKNRQVASDLAKMNDWTKVSPLGSSAVEEPQLQLHGPNSTLQNPSDVIKQVTSNPFIDNKQLAETLAARPTVGKQISDFISNHGKGLAVAGGVGAASLGALGLYHSWKKNQDKKKQQELLRQQQQLVSAY